MMSSFFSNVSAVSNDIALHYGISLHWFLVIYLSSYIPFYFGYFLILYGTTRHLNFRDVLRFRLKNQLHWTTYSMWGLIIHLFGRLMPYVYILCFSRGLPFWVYLLVSSVALLSVSLILKRLGNHKKAGEHRKDSVTAMKRERIVDHDETERLWEIYNKTFEKVNRLSPCRQSLDREHFMEVLHDTTVAKYLLVHTNAGIIGIGLITNDFKNTPWISSEYFQFHYPESFEKRHIYYFMGLAIDERHRGQHYSLTLIEHIIDDLPHHAILGFDHSGNVNPMLHHFTKVVKQARSIERTHLDRQHYHIVKRV